MSRAGDAVDRDAGPEISGRATPGELARLVVLATVWLLLAQHLLPFAAKHAPMAVQKAMSFSAFRGLSQLATVGLGLGLAFLIVPSAAKVLGLVVPTGKQTLVALSLVPVTFVVATAVGIAIALPTLMDELATRGLGTSQRNAGGLGRELVGSSLWSTLLVGALFAAFSEELLFRGAVFSALDRAFSWIAPRTPAPELVGRELRSTSPADRLRTIVASGWGAAVVSAVVFGWMHADMPGGVGIVRVVSTTCLGLATGAVRVTTRSILASALLHASYNTLSVGNARGWFVSPTLGAHYGVPTVMIALAGISCVVLGVLVWRQRGRVEGGNLVATTTPGLAKKT